MTYMFDNYNYIVKLKKGERLAPVLEEFCGQTGIQGGWLSGVGGADQVTIGFYDLEKQEYEWKTFEGAREVVSLTGNLAKNEQGKMMFHLHGAFGDREFQTIGGHVKDLVVGGTLELFVHRTWKPLTRKTDPEVGLQTLDV